MLEFLLVAPLPGGIEGAEHLSEQLAVFGGFLEIAAENHSGLLNNADRKLRHFYRRSRVNKLSSSRRQRLLQQLNVAAVSEKHK
jgi:hypothetical protein